MDIVYNLFVLLHFVGFAALFGGAFVQLKGPRRTVNAAMFHGALTQLVTGIVLVGLWEMGLKGGDADPNMMKLGIKMLVLIVIMVLVFLNRKKEHIVDATFWSIFALTLANAAIAVFW